MLRSCADSKLPSRLVEKHYFKSFVVKVRKMQHLRKPKAFYD